jgi:hypothetical protein
MNLFITYEKLSPVSCYCLLLTLKYLPRHVTLRNLQLITFS